MLKLSIILVIIALCNASPYAGGWKESDVTSEVSEIAQWASSQLSSTDDHQVVRITNVKKQLVAGVNYKFSLELLVNGKVTKVCEMNIFDQPWTNTREFNEEPKCRTLDGGWSQSEVTPEVEEVASWAAAQLAAASNNEEHSIVKISDVTTQVVSGINYKLTLELLVGNTVKKVCELNIYDQPWTNTRLFNEEPKCHLPSEILAGWKESEVTDKVMELAGWASNQLSNGQHSVVKVSNVFSQLVSGMNYKFDLELLVDGKITKVCQMNIFDQPWTSIRKFNEEPKCSIAAETKSLGGWNDAEVDDTVREIAAWAAQELTGFMNVYFQDIQPKNVQKQIVNGINYKFTLELIINGKVSKECEMNVYDNPWTKTREFNKKPVCSVVESKGI